MTTITISLPDSLRSYIQKRVKRDGYGTASEYLRGLIREDQARKTRDRLESLLMEGLDSELSEMTSGDWDDIRAEVKRRRVSGQRKRRAK